MTKPDHGAIIAEEHGLVRSPHWHSTEKAFLKDHPFCLACGPSVNYERGLQVHHAIIPFHYAILLGRPDLELDPRNLCVLCEDEKDVETEDHHLLIGHGRSFRRYLPNAIDLAKGKYHRKKKAEIIADSEYLAICASMPKEWKDMTDHDKQVLKKMLDQVIPLAGAGGVK